MRAHGCICMRFEKQSNRKICKQTPVWLAQNVFLAIETERLNAVKNETRALCKSIIISFYSRAHVILIVFERRMWSLLLLHVILTFRCWPNVHLLMYPNHAHDDHVLHTMSSAAGALVRPFEFNQNDGAAQILHSDVDPNAMKYRPSSLWICDLFISAAVSVASEMIPFNYF